MKIVFLNSTPLAGMPWRTALVCGPEAERSGGWFRSVTSKAGYGRGRVYPHDVLGDARHLLVSQADLVVTGAYGSDRIHGGKPVVRHYSTEQFRWKVQDPPAGSATVVAQYQARFAPQLEVLPNCIPIDREMWKPAEKPSDRIVVVYCPTNRTAATPPNPQGWASKSYPEVMEAFRKIRNDMIAEDRENGTDEASKVEFVVLENRPYEEVMKAKRHAHIVVDEVTTGSYHSSGLEGLSCGAATICWIDEETERALRRLLPTDAVDQLPFFRSTRFKFEVNLRMLISNATFTRYLGHRSREWMEKWYMEKWQASTWMRWHENYLKSIVKTERS